MKNICKLHKMTFRLFLLRVFISLLTLAFIPVLISGQYFGKNFGQCFAQNLAEVTKKEVLKKQIPNEQGSKDEIAKKEIAKGLEYQIQKENNHIIHIVTIDPTRYRLELVKGHNQVFGRETVVSMAARKNAIAAINGGFFEIGNNEDGRPSGTLIINNNILALAKKERALLTIEDNKINIGRIETEINVVFQGEIEEKAQDTTQDKVQEKIKDKIQNKTQNQKISPNKVNQFLKKDEIGLYNTCFGPTTLTTFERREILIDKNNIITHIIEHGDNIIPFAGVVLSFPKSYPIPFAKVGDKIILERVANNTSSNTQSKLPSNALMGIPIIVENGQAMTDIKKLGSKAFAETPHARTAVGIRADGSIIFVVAEHVYTQPLDKLSVEEARNILREKGYSQQKINGTTLSQMLTIIQNIPTSTLGLSLPELAKLMVNLNCVQAINLDGGGSSTLFLKGRVMNTTIGDTDESMGQKTLRPVSDTIVVLKTS